MGYKQKSSFVSVKDTENTLLCTLCQKQKAFNNEKYRILFNEMSDMTAEQECEIFPYLTIHPSFSRYQKLGSHWLLAKRLF